MAFRQLCPDGWVVTGLAGASRDTVDSVSVICSPLRIRRAPKAAENAIEAACRRGDAKACLDAGDAAETDRQRARLYKAAALAYRQAAVAASGERPPLSGRPPTRVRSRRPVDYDAMVSKRGEFTYAVDGAKLDDMLIEPRELIGQTRVVPNYRRGTYEGFKLVGVRPGSLYRALGIRSGDIVRSVNGKAFDAPGQLSGLMETVAGKKRVVVVIERRGKTLTFTYDIDRP